MSAMTQEKRFFLAAKGDRLPTIYEDCCLTFEEPKNFSYIRYFSYTNFICLILLLCCDLMFYANKLPHHLDKSSHSDLYEIAPNKLELVISTSRGSDISWVHDHLGSLPANIYRLDDPHTLSPSVPSTKGAEAMAYLTFIIDRYQTLPDVTVFLSDKRYIWSNDNPLYDNVISIIDLQTSFVKSAGYVNLRCALKYGCSAQLESNAIEYPLEFLKLFPTTTLPEVIGIPTGNQFAVSRDKILERTREEYIKYRDWLIETPLGDESTSKLLEYSWHIIFGKPPQFCLDPKECYCQTFGRCGMTENDIEKQWVDRGRKLPDSWPGTSSMIGVKKETDVSF